MSERREHILVVDDEQGIRDQLYWALNDDWEVSTAADVVSALAATKEYRPALVILDINLDVTRDTLEGIDLIGQILDIEPKAKVIMVTGHGQKENAIQCIERGAYDFFNKPVEIEELRTVIRRGLYLRRLEMEHQQLQSELTEYRRYGDIIGTSEQMQRVFSFIETVAENNYTVLVTGESGTGKELVARAIHGRSPRREKPFMAINCGAIPETLLESELFGYEKGAFTDAREQRIGLFEQADGGTVLLDEIGEMSMKLQVKLLRFLEERKVQRLGGGESIPIDVRIIAATNRDLQEEVKAGNFREDLFYRISVLHLALPPLRDRGEDIIFLANYFLERFSEDNGRKGLKFDSPAIQVINRARWSGNVRELENRVKRAVIMCQGKTVSPVDLGFEAAAEADEPELITLQQVREYAEREHLKRALIAHNYNISKVSRELETSRTTLYELMDKYGLRKDEKG